MEPDVPKLIEDTLRRRRILLTHNCDCDKE